MTENHPCEMPELKVEPLLENKYLKAYDLQYAPGKHYFEASRRPEEKLVASMSDDEFRSMLPDAVTCVVILTDGDGGNARLLLNHEFRYPCVVNPDALQYVTTKPMYDPEQALNCTLKADLGDGLDKYHELWQQIRFN